MAKVAVFIADGSEEVEAITPVDLLRRAKVDVDVVSVMPALEITASREVKVTAERRRPLCRCRIRGLQECQIRFRQP
jgi:4-methyl-5(b-hydroxyethyl)-thiazole monophosphate biosynthesis